MARGALTSSLIFGGTLAFIGYTPKSDIGSEITPTDPIESARMSDAVQNQTDPVAAQNFCLYLAKERDSFRAAQDTLLTRLEFLERALIWFIACTTLGVAILNAYLLSIFQYMGAENDEPDT